MNYKEYLNYLINISETITEGYELTKNFRMILDIDRIAFVGVGDSSIVGKIMINLFGREKDIYQINDYHLPKFFDSKTLLFLISYEGNDEEVLYALKDGLRQNCRMIAVTSGGKLNEIAFKDNIKTINLPKNINSSLSLYYSFFSILRVLTNLNIIDDHTPEVEGLSNVLMHKSNDKSAKILSEKIGDKIPLIYIPNKFDSIAYRWKTQFNKIGKISSFTNTIPEMNHNEIMSYSFENPDFFVIFLRDENLELRIKKRIGISKDIIKRSCPVLEIEIKGKSNLAKIFSAINLGDLTAVYMSLNKNINPLSFNILEELNTRLKKDFIFY